MKNFRILLSATLMIFTLSSAAWAGIPEDVTAADLRDRVVELIDNHRFVLDQETVAHIEFQVNEQGEIVILSVQSEDNRLDSYIKYRLNYKNANIGYVEPGQPYFIDVRFKL